MENIKDKLIKKLLSEHTMPEINSFKVFDKSMWSEPQDTDSDELEEHLEYLYELEYKYSMLLTKGFHGNEKRRENIIKIIERKLRLLLSSLSEVLIRLFKFWVNIHNVNDWYQWGLSRVYDSIEGFSTTDMYSYIVDMIKREIGLSEYPIVERVIENLEMLPNIKGVLEEQMGYIVDEMRGNMESELDDYGVETFNEEYDTNFKDYDSAYEYIQEKEYTFDDLVDLGYFDGLSIISNDVEALGELYGFFLHDNWLNQYGPQVEEKIEEFEYWIEKLENIEKYSIKEQVVLFNRTLNLTHTTGKMTEYMMDLYGVGEDELDELSDANTTEWDKELKLIGIKV